MMGEGGGSSSVKAAAGKEEGGSSSVNPFAYLRNVIPSSLPHLRISNSDPVTPPLSSPTSKSPKPNNLYLESFAKQSISTFNLQFSPSSAPTSPTRYQRIAPATIPECDESDCSTIDSCQWVRFKNCEPVMTNPNSPTFNLVKPMAPVIAINNAASDKGKSMEFEFPEWRSEGMGRREDSF